MAPVSSKEFLDIQTNMECRFTLKCVRDMTRTYSHTLKSLILYELVGLAPKKLKHSTLTLLCVMLKNSQTQFKNLAVFIKVFGEEKEEFQSVKPFQEGLGVQ